MCKEETKKLLIKHYQTYPKLQIRDILKFLHQSAFGCEHLISDFFAVTEYIRNEAMECQIHEGELIEPLDGEYCRVHLDYIKQGLNAETLGKLFCLSAVHNENGKQLLEEKLSVLLELIKEGTLPFKERDVREAIEEWKSDGFPACHHSEEFRNAYFPAYRVIKKEYALFLSLFVKIDNMLQRGSVNLAIEGGCASGKSTLGKLLKQVYDCTVFHMDDFFLQPKQRTRERLEEPGGNVDRERFLQEVLSPLSQNIPIEYRSFDCHTLTLQPSIMLFPKKLNVVEGVYCMHPELERYYNLSVFLDITPKQQKERIRKRNSKEFAERFFNEWIPMEQRYFEAMDVKKRCDINIEIGD